MISVGVFECFFGYKMLKPTLFIFGYLTGFGLLLAILGEFIIGPDTEGPYVLVLLLGTVLIGSCLGYTFMATRELGIMCIGAWLGFIIAMLLYSSLFYKIGVRIKNN